MVPIKLDTQSEIALVIHISALKACILLWSAIHDDKVITLSTSPFLSLYSLIVLCLVQLATNCCSHPRMLNANSTHTAGQAQRPFGRTVVRSVGPSSGVFNCDHCVAHSSQSHCPSIPLSLQHCLAGTAHSDLPSALRTPQAQWTQCIAIYPSSPLSMSFSLSLCRSVCPLPLPMPSTTSSTFFSLHFWCFIQHLDGAFECLNSTRLESRQDQSRPRDELPRQLSIQSISIQSKLSESICLPSGIPLPLSWHICCQSQRVIYAIIIRVGVQVRLRFDVVVVEHWQTNQLFVFWLCVCLGIVRTLQILTLPLPLLIPLALPLAST